MGTRLQSFHVRGLLFYTVVLGLPFTALPLHRWIRFAKFYLDLDNIADKNTPHRVKVIGGEQPVPPRVNRRF